MFTKYDSDIDLLISKMTLREKIGQLNQPETPRPDRAEEFKEMVRRGEIGSILMAVGATAGNDPQGDIDTDFYNELQRIAVEESRLGIPIIFGRDVIHGHRTVLPVPLGFSASFDPEKIEECFRDVSEEASNDGIHWTFTPMLDIARDPRWGRIAEGAGEDPYLARTVARAVVKGFQGDDPSSEGRMVACAKHFVGYGASEGGRDYHRTEISDYTLYNTYLPPFREAIDAGVMTVMSSFNDISGVPVSGSRYYLTDILRDKLGFEGMVVSDYGCVTQLRRQGVCETDAEASAIAIDAGVDMDMWDCCYIKQLEDLVRSGKVSERTVDLAVKRVLRVKYAKGLFDKPYCNHTELDRTEHLQRARSLAADSMVLLKNENKLLPINKDSTIALIGPFANERRSLLGTWTVDGKEEETPTLAEAMESAVKDFGGRVTVKEYDTLGKGGVLSAAAKADCVVLAIGESWRRSGENKSVSDISITDDQLDMIRSVKAIGKRLIGVMFCARPIAMQGIAEYFDALIYAWHGGSETASALCDVLFGDVVPSGKLPVTIPRLATHIPLYYNVTSSGRPVNCYYGENPASCYVDSYPTPCYPFGYGLSYTEFAYSPVRVETGRLTRCELGNGKKFVVSVDVTNVGDFDGKETVQLYIHDVSAKLMRPLRELKAYKKVLINRGETANVCFELGSDDLGYYLPDGSYTVEKGRFEIFIGSDCLTDNIAEIVLE